MLCFAPFRILVALWMKLGELLGKVNSFLILSLIYLVFFVPMGFFYRLRLQRKKPYSQVESFFIDRKAQPGSMKYQF